MPEASESPEVSKEPIFNEPDQSGDNLKESVSFDIDFSDDTKKSYRKTPKHALFKKKSKVKIHTEAADKIEISESDDLCTPDVPRKKILHSKPKESELPLSNISLVPTESAIETNTAIPENQSFQSNIPEMKAPELDFPQKDNEIINTVTNKKRVPGKVKGAKPKSKLKKITTYNKKLLEDFDSKTENDMPINTNLDIIDSKKSLVEVDDLDLVEISGSTVDTANLDGSESSPETGDSSMKNFFDSEEYQIDETSTKKRSTDWRSKSGFRRDSSLHRERRLSNENNKILSNDSSNLSTRNDTHIRKDLHNTDIPLLPKRRMYQQNNKNNAPLESYFTKQKSKKDVSKSLESINVDDSDDYSMLMKKHGLKQGMEADQEREELPFPLLRSRVPSALRSSHSDSEDVVLITESQRPKTPRHSNLRSGSKSTPITPRGYRESDSTDTSAMFEGDESLRLPLSGRSTDRPKSVRPISSVESDQGESCDSGISVSDTR